VDTADGTAYAARILVAGIGGLHIPHVPRLPGREQFTGVTFHSARWRHDVDLTGKRVAVVGTGASAIQFVPLIARHVKHLSVFQRTAPWVLPRPDRPIASRTRTRYRRVPGLQRLHRYGIYWLLEARALGFNGHPALLHAAERIVASQLERKVVDPLLRRQLLPDYRLGCKRVLSANDYYPTFNRDNVDLVPGAVERITATGVVGSDGVERAADVIIYATGFEVRDSFAYVSLRGRGGSTLWEQFKRDGAETYLGINVVNFPNLCLLLGPNTALGHHSVVFMIEQQAAYVIRLLDAMHARRAQTVEVRPEAQQRYSDEIQTKLARGIWSTGGCTSWYLDAEGKNRTIWPGFTFSYWWRTRRLDADAYVWGQSAGPPRPWWLTAPRRLLSSSRSPAVSAWLRRGSAE
jgi:cation diffusion facilitator CzcD-associated flavoprotein CzcO